jgi:hypothetical protein
MLVKCHEHLHPLVESKMSILDHNVFNISLSKLQMLNARACPQGIIDLTKYQMNVKGIKVFFSMMGKT